MDCFGDYSTVPVPSKILLALIAAQLSRLCAESLLKLNEKLNGEGLLALIRL